ncbi:MAG: hypothetical protein ACK58L_10295 [Planctomycetota bacterium]
MTTGGGEDRLALSSRVRWNEGIRRGTFRMMLAIEHQWLPAECRTPVVSKIAEPKLLVTGFDRVRGSQILQSG